MRERPGEREQRFVGEIRLHMEGLVFFLREFMTKADLNVTEFQIHKPPADRTGWVVTCSQLEYQVSGILQK